MRGDARYWARQAWGIDSDIPEFGDEVGLRRLVRRAIERVRAKDIAEADKRA
jgi:hypothetical protein